MPLAADIRKIVSAPESVDLAPIAEAADLIVDGCTASSSYTAERIAAIKKWVGAHLFASTDMGRESRLVSETLVDLSQTFAVSVGKGFHLTTYGQQAMLLDPDGCLAQLSQKQSDGVITPGLDWLGKDPVPFSDIANL